MFQDYLTSVVSGQNLTAQEAEAAMRTIMTGEASPAQIGAYLVGLRMKGETVDEIAGSARAMGEVVNRVTVQQNGSPLLDTCGTGGDGSHSFNISTAAAFVIAGAGLKVGKHGNRAASSVCGSADVLSELGLNLDLSPRQVEICIEEVGIGFMFAPRFHPAMKYAVGPRKEIGVRTIFNILGPLTNPAGATHQLVGVYDAALTDPLAKVLGALGRKAALVVHGYGGLDELTTGGPNKASLLRDNKVTSYMIDPLEFGLKAASNGDLRGGSPMENAVRMRKLLTGEERGSLRDVVLLNAAAGISLTDGDLETGFEVAFKSLDSGAAIQKMNDLIKISQQLAGQVE